MKKIFSENLEAYSHELRNEAASPEELELYEFWQKGMAAYELKTDFATQDYVYELQKRKQEVMLELNQRLADLDRPKAEKQMQEYERPVVFEGDHYVWLDGKDRRPVTLGEIMTDGEWNDERAHINIQYELDESVKRSIRKKYLVDNARRKLRGYLNEQIIASESASGLTDARKAEAYGRMRRDHENGVEQKAAGLIAEKMVRNFLKKISLDFDCDFEIFESDAYDDMVKKIDFIIHRKDRQRGVKVDANKNNKGVQFTINLTKLDFKQKQVDYVNAHLGPEDLVDRVEVVFAELDHVTPKFQDWLKTKAPGGPDKLWSRADRQSLFRGLMVKFLTEEEIEKYCQKIV